MLIIMTCMIRNSELLYKSVENTIISMALVYNRPVLVDRGLNVSLRGRKRWLALAKSFDVPCEAIVLEKAPAKIHAERRYKSDNRCRTYDYWLEVAQVHESLYVEPTIEEGFNKVHHLLWEDIAKGKVI